MAFTLWWGVVCQPHLDVIACGYPKCASAPPALLETPAILLHCSAPSALGATHLLTLGEWIPLHCVASKAIVAPPQPVIYPLPLAYSNHIVYSCQAYVPNNFFV